MRLGSPNSISRRFADRTFLLLKLILNVVGINESLSLGNVAIAKGTIAMMTADCRWQAVPFDQRPSGECRCHSHAACETVIDANRATGVLPSA